ncbi:MAG: hypothetical protein QNJ55_02165 [Xenococcus sp. MO_188.B8]|nr:hypothetical protein [Xenococcus sp. MO_188.B8]
MRALLTSLGEGLSFEVSSKACTPRARREASTLGQRYPLGNPLGQSLY